MSDVVFLQMPFAGLERPSLALGLFTAALREAGIPLETIYANLAFAEKIGLLAFVLVRSSSPGALLGEWLFSESAFGEASHRPPEAALDRANFELPDEAIDFVLSESGHGDLEAFFLDLRRKATELIAELAQTVIDRSPKAVACTSMFDQHVASLALLRRIKAHDSRILTVIGGANCAGPMGRATHASFPYLDFTVTGEFDSFVVEFFRQLVDAKGEAANVTLPPNTLGPEHRTAGSEEQTEPPAVFLADMDRAAVPDYNDYFEQLYSSPLSRYIRPSLPVETSRGCWWGARQHCTFCGLNAEGMAFRKKTPARAVEEIRTLTTRHNVFRVAAADNIIDMSYFQSVLPALASDGKAYNLFYETKGNLKREHIQAFAEAGCSFIQPGIESLHDETLRIMRKGITACANLQTLKHCLELGVFPEWNILCGFPGSDPAWLSEVAVDLPMLFHLPPANGVFPIRFDRFSPYHQHPEDYGLALEPLPSYGRVYPLRDAVLKDLAYFFRQTEGFPKGVSQSARTAMAAVKRWSDEFWGPNRPRLEIEQDEGGLLQIRDTRSCATAEFHLLEGLPAMLLRALESPATLPGLLARLQQKGSAAVGEDEAAAGLDALSARRLIWRSSTQYLALPVRPPKRPMPSKADPAVGRVDLARYIVEKARFRLAFA